jgi:hypothetical protein
VFGSTDFDCDVVTVLDVRHTANVVGAGTGVCTMDTHWLVQH